MKITGQLSDVFTLFNEQKFNEIKKKKLTPSYDIQGLKYFRIKAGNERDLRESYRDRATYELLQNADDASATRAFFILVNDGLAFVHDGNWFTVRNFESLADGWSDKDPRECIGHKGLGFRSVLDITPAPHILKIDAHDFFAFRFSWAINNGHIHETFRRFPELRSEYEEWEKGGRIACPIMCIPGLANKINLGEGANIFNSIIKGKYGDRLTTMFWFPKEDPEIPKNVLTDLSPNPILANQAGKNKLLDFLKNEILVLIPFLKNIENIIIYNNEQILGKVIMDGRKNSNEPAEINVKLEIDRHTITESFFQSRFILPIPFNIRSDSKTPLVIRKSDNSKKVQLALSVKLINGQPSSDLQSRFHVYFPTDEKTGTGFVVHGDFYVKPDRTRLMPGKYNDWLLKEAAQKAANEFLTILLEKYSPRKVFDALADTDSSTIESGNSFVTFFSEALRKRKKSFVPTRLGLLPPNEVLVPPHADQAGFWDTHFGDSLQEAWPEKKAFLSPIEDGRRTRQFLKLAGMKPLEEESIINFIEVSGAKKKDVTWWYDCYSYMANSQELFRGRESLFKGRKLIPLEDFTLREIPKEKGDIVCLPPEGEISSLAQPRCFQKIFVLFNKELANIIQKAEDPIKKWILEHLCISKFEATDILPRTIRSIVTDIFNNSIDINLAELKKAWSFIHKVTQASSKVKAIEAKDFWEEIGRFPVPLKGALFENNLSPGDIVPAFLAFWPDIYIEGHNCVREIQPLRRICDVFLEQLISESDNSQEEWVKFFNNTGISSAPKLLTYSRVVGRPDLAYEINSPDELSLTGFSGERQLDKNRSIIEALTTEHLWNEIVAETQSCGHEAKKVLQSLSLLEGLETIVQEAAKEWEAKPDGPEWRQRLETLWRRLPIDTINEGFPTEAHCFGGERGGHPLESSSYVNKQLRHYRWLPSTNGPASYTDCFLRLSTRRLISSGRLNIELGDILLPYVVVENDDDYHRLIRLGIEKLEDVESASPATLVRALSLIGARLSTGWGREYILSDRAKWRLVRGPLQQIYSKLNQDDIHVDFPTDIRVATHYNQILEFRPLPIYFAEPGSPVELAFKNTLPLLDADRPFPQLFERLGIIRLDRGDALNENFLDESSAVSANSLKEEIINDLGPYLLSPIIAKSEKDKQGEQALRRLTERFVVKSAPSLRVSFSLNHDPSIKREIDFPKFYLQEKSVKVRGAVDETHYTLYVRGNNEISIGSLDADALGESLTSMFKESLSGDLSGIFFRIVTRYQQIKSSRPDKLKLEMQDFLHLQLGVSLAAQDKALAFITGEEIIVSSPPPPPPPPIFITNLPKKHEGTGGGISITDMISSHAQRLEEKARAQFDHFIPGAGSQKNTGSESSLSPNTGIKQSEVTPDQQVRGRLGEEEMKRRLSLPGGYGGFFLISDKRTEGCGYDFLCKKDGREVKLEVKTFTPNGSIFMTSREIKEALINVDNYYLVGIMDDGGPEGDWKVSIKQKPINVLLEKGDFNIKTNLQISASEIFEDMVK